jgi:hypothetical protein
MVQTFLAAFQAACGQLLRIWRITMAIASLKMFAVRASVLEKF